MQELIVFGVVGAIAIGFFVLIKVLVAKAGSANLDKARSAFHALSSFEPSDILVYLGSAISVDRSTGNIAIWEKKSGARIVGAHEVGAWHCGELLSTVMGETTSSLMVQLYATNSEAPLFKVGVLKKQDLQIWREHLSKAFGANKERGSAQRTIGPDFGD